jgi:4-methylaminobutanoate oxidase (formaldehyde-forming)
VQRGRAVAVAGPRLLADWIVDGAPPIDLSPLTPARFGGLVAPDTELRRDAAWQYRHFYGAV